MKYSIRRIRNIICLTLVGAMPMPKSVRVKMTQWGGVNVSNPKHTFIGNYVIFDTLYPERITIGNHVHITTGVTILTHSLDTTREKIAWKKTSVTIEDDCFIGANSIICNDVTIGKNSIVGAGSIVTKSIPPNEVWAGNPARFIRKRVNIE